MGTVSNDDLEMARAIYAKINELNELLLKAASQDIDVLMSIETQQNITGNPVSGIAISAQCSKPIYFVGKE